MANDPLNSGPSPLFISTMKNEGPYILEWVAYHRVVGFRDFLIYTNDCEDGTVEILERLTAMGVVRHEPNKVLLRGPHKSALKYALAHEMTAAADWIWIADIDEYLNVHLGDGTVQALIAARPEADVIPVTWRLFSHDDAVEFEDVSLIETMTDAEMPLAEGGQTMRFVKSLFRMGDQVERFGLHGPRFVAGATPKWVQPDGHVMTDPSSLTRPHDHFAYDGAQVNHYAVRSIDGYLVKKHRGRANHVKQVLGTDYWRKMCRGGERDTTIHRHLDATKAEMARLLKDAELARLHAASVDWHKAKIADLLKEREFRRVRAQIMNLSEARDHHRAVVAEAPQPPKSDEALARIQALCKEMRGLIDEVEPVEAASNAAGTLDTLEKGLFGATSR